ncbi:hypothetical protein GS399_05335 [Pedobacter sp. HMF7647]|uniref:Uncharacterized protein n=1 Tax=Hufsiella arboris TaxID=2695275 RepID=A0A7K1Y8L8_9SPHI|nr:tail fiber protein [Hufsiella arboris]MXV50388.1 hypothetical protein [Hufsiella arboris]
MKKILAMILLLAGPFCLFAQNKFPPTGYTGIGTDSPINGLHLVSSDSESGGSFRFGFSGAKDAVLSYGWDGVSQDALRLSQYTHNSFAGRADLLYIASSNGYMGLGTNAPQSRLSIATGVLSGIANEVFSALDVGPQYGAGHFGNGAAIYLKSATNEGIQPVAGLWSSLRDGGNGQGTYAGALVFGTKSNETAGVTEKMRIRENGDVGIGTQSPDAKLTVKGRIHSEEVKVDLSVPAPDYVFDADYSLASLTELHNYIREHRHLPEIPSAGEIAEKGLELGDMNMRLLKKIEELTLYLLEKDEKIERLQKRLSSIETKLNMKTIK